MKENLSGWTGRPSTLDPASLPQLRRLPAEKRYPVVAVALLATLLLGVGAAI